MQSQSSGCCKESFTGSFMLGGTLIAVQFNPLLVISELRSFAEGLVQSSFDSFCGWTSIQTIWAICSNV